MKKTAGANPSVSGQGLKIGIVVGRFNQGITAKLLAGAERVLKRQGVSPSNIENVWVPGAFEIPVMLQALARRRKFDAFIALGAVVRGDTPHFEYVCEGATMGIQRVSLDTGVPVAFGLLTTDNMKQALERVGGRHGHKGEEAALVALEMARLVKRGK
jgi:6,7-dimethyl-8-ribityllumazine synthase